MSHAPSPPDAQRQRQLRRAFLVIAVLRSRGGTSLTTLARECGVSERTSRRDLIALEAAGFPIFTVGEWNAKLYRFPRGTPCPICGKDVLSTSRPHRLKQMREDGDLLTSEEVADIMEKVQMEMKWSRS